MYIYIYIYIKRECACMCSINIMTIMNIIIIITILIIIIESVYKEGSFQGGDRAKNEDSKKQESREHRTTPFWDIP